MSDPSLAGRRVLVTRDIERARAAAVAVERRGGVAVVFPVIAFAPPLDPGPLERALRSIRDYTHVAVSSPTGAAVLARGVPEGLLASLAPGRPRFVAVGRKTASVLEKAGANGVRVPERQDAEGLLASLLEDGAAAGRTLVLRAEMGRDVAIDGLRAAGGIVEVVVAYRTVTASPTAAEIDALCLAPPPDAALFLSPSAFDGLFGILGEARARALLQHAVRIAIGDVTAAAMAARGLPPDRIPPRPDLETVLDTLAEALAPVPA